LVEKKNGGYYMNLPGWNYAAVSLSGSVPTICSGGGGGGGNEGKCIAFVNGVGEYDEHCYKSGLKNMANGKCYTMNPDRKPSPVWINDEADQTWWWIETSCD
jgi:hypothetical protein